MPDKRIYDDSFIQTLAFVITALLCYIYDCLVIIYEKFSSRLKRFFYAAWTCCRRWKYQR